MRCKLYVVKELAFDEYDVNGNAIITDLMLHYTIFV